VRPRPGSATGPLLPVAVVVLAATAFDAVTGTGWWSDHIAAKATPGWNRTLVSTGGFLWITAVVVAVVAGGIRVVASADAPHAAGTPGAAGDAPERPVELRASLGRLLGVALLPIALAWFVAHDLTIFLQESQNFIALLSDPIGRGWDLLGTIDITPDYGLYRGAWVRWVQLGALLVGHAAAVVLAHDGAIGLFGRRRGMRVTWLVAVLSATSIVAAALLVLK
jgi:hypothetical protein